MSIFGSLNQISISGYVGGDPEFNFTKDGTAIDKFSVAIDSWDFSANAKKTIWMNIVVFGKLAETCEKWVGKGTKVVVSGRFDENEWTDKEGNRRKSHSIIASEVVIVEKAESVKAASAKFDEDL